MVRWVFLLRYPDGVSKEDGERWYLETHTQEAKTLRGLRRYRSWNALKAKVAPPWTTVEALNRWDRVTELVFDDFASWHEAAIANPPAYTPPPYGDRGFVSETIFIGEDADDNFLATPASLDLDAVAREALVRWIFVLRYRDETPKPDGEEWYLGTHTQEAKLMPGLSRYVSFRRQVSPEGMATNTKWDRLTELAFADWRAWETSAVERMPKWTPPPYEGPGFLSETVFIHEEPEHDFLRPASR